MGTLYIRDFPDELQRRLRVCAAMETETTRHVVSMKDIVIRAVEAECAKIERKGKRR